MRSSPAFPPPSTGRRRRSGAIDLVHRRPAPRRRRLARRPPRHPRRHRARHAGPVRLVRHHVAAQLARQAARAAAEPFLPRPPTTTTARRPRARQRFGDEVHERLVDALVGSIYATDTDPSASPRSRSSLRSPTTAACCSRRAAVAPARCGPAGRRDAPIFAAPRAGMAPARRATADDVRPHQRRHDPTR